MQDGWYRTGDQGTLDDQGFLTLQGRQKDMLVMPDGTKVHPADIEQALIRDPRVRDARGGRPGAAGQRDPGPRGADPPRPHRGR